MSEDKGLVRRITEAATSAGGALKGAVDLAKEVNALQVDYNVKSKTIELLDKLIDARTGQYALTELLGEAKQRIVELESLLEKKKEWDNEKLNYEMYHPITNTVVYVLKPTNDPKFKPHYLCTTCYEAGVKSILQYHSANIAYKILKCHKCSAEYKFPKNIERENSLPNVVSEYDPFNPSIR
ncbi:hypothetical protein [Citrobacter amalonaticus]|uniref:hypothetical protein n=1 Tax=Citrobacter amalonaticus TaxID=35703 RepID=UPI001E5BB684|nr:hypothetical protein [Citrobacter amalonaticus]